MRCAASRPPQPKARRDASERGDSERARRDASERAARRGAARRDAPAGALRETRQRTPTGQAPRHERARDALGEPRVGRQRTHARPHTRTPPGGDVQAAESARNTSRARGGAHYETAKSHLLPGLIASARAAPNYRAAVAAPEPRAGWLAGGPAGRRPARRAVPVPPPHTSSSFPPPRAAPSHRPSALRRARFQPPPGPTPQPSPGTAPCGGFCSSPPGTRHRRPLRRASRPSLLFSLRPPRCPELALLLPTTNAENRKTEIIRGKKKTSRGASPCGRCVAGGQVQVARSSLVARCRRRTVSVEAIASFASLTAAAERTLRVRFARDARALSAALASIDVV